MSISVSCPKCGRILQAQEDMLGRRVRCPCGQPITVEDDGGVLNLLKEELNIDLDPLSCQTPDEWVKATGAPPEVAEQLQRKLKPKASGNATFMMGLAGAIAAVMLVVGVAVYLFAK